ncbi:hypothetical protein F903_02097 [Acinetobacter sp. NIPH 298]|nr:hypothetical protein F903_02097 [Acinetobacter sp. NIPH 298]
MPIVGKRLRKPFPLILLQHIAQKDIRSLFIVGGIVECCQCDLTVKKVIVEIFLYEKAQAKS